MVAVQPKADDGGVAFAQGETALPGGAGHAAGGIRRNGLLRGIAGQEIGHGQVAVGHAGFQDGAGRAADAQQPGESVVAGAGNGDDGLLGRVVDAGDDTGDSVVHYGVNVMVAHAGIVASSSASAPRGWRIRPGRRVNIRHGGQRDIHLAGDFAVPFIGPMLGQAWAGFPPGQALAAVGFSRQNLHQERGHVAAVHGVDDAAVEIAKAAFQQGAAGCAH